ncbi:MAG: hypothetical protein II363_00685 [Clostridia bacterium]|nr:hypothetical protein [Clostridia bacterium]
MMNKRLLSVIVSIALLLSSVSVTGVLMASANGGSATVTPLTSGNIATTLPTNNLLATATKLSNSTRMQSGEDTVGRLYDGLIKTLNSDTASVTSFHTNVGIGTAVDRDGNRVAKTGGTTTIGFQLSEKMTIKQLVIAGNPGANSNYRIYNDTTYANAYAAAGDTFNGAYFDECNVLYCEIYIANEASKLYDDASLVYVYDNTTDPQLAELITLATPVDGQFVGFKLASGYWFRRLSELGVYGSEIEQTGPVITLKPSNIATKLPSENLLATAVKLSSSTTMSSAESSLANLYDGLIHTLNSDTDAHATFYNKIGTGTAVDRNGNRVAKTGGTTTIGFKLSEKMTIKQFVIAGRPNSNDNMSINSSTDYANAYTAAGDTFASPTYFDDRNVRYCEIYISNDESKLYDAASLAYVYDNTIEPQLAELITLPTPVDGQFVGFKMSSGYYFTRLSELGVYGSEIEQTGPVITLTPRNIATKLPETNLLISAKLEKGKIGSGLYSGLSDGLIYPLNSTTAGACGFYREQSTYTKIDGTVLDIPKIDGMAQLSFRLENEATIRQFLIAGDETRPDNWVLHNSDGTKTYFDNRNILYFEIYVADTAEELYTTDTLVFSYDNSTEPILAMLITLDQAVHGRYVGFKVSTGAYGWNVYSELGVYGDMEMAPAFPYDAFTDKNTMDTLVNGQENLLLGDKVAGKPADYLPPSGVASFTNPQYMTDDKLGFGATEELQEAVYGNSDGNSTFYYDLRGEANLTNLLFANHALNTEVGKRLSTITVYLSNDLNTLFDTPAGVVRLNGMAGGAVVSLPANTRARYVGLAIAAGTDGKVRIGELGVYGAYVDENAVSPYPTNLVLHEDPVYTAQVPARGIDNKTAVDENGNPGTGNTGTLNKQEKMGDPLNNGSLETKITDGDTSTFSQVYIKNTGGNSLVYNTQWAVYVYYLGGKSNIEDISLYSSAGFPNYYTAGVQYYASEKFADLFKNESLLYTTGGEHYIVDQANSSEEDGIAYLPDPNYEKNQAVHSYSLSAEQRDKLCRYVAVVVTRPYPRYNPYDGTSLNVGWNLVRIGEIIVNGVRVENEAPVQNTYTASTSKGNVNVTIQTINPDDRPFFDYLDRVEIVEEKLDASVNKTVYRNWMSVDGETVYHVKLVDKDGNLITLEGPDSDKALNGREMEFHFPPTADYVQAMGVIENGVMRQVMNSYTYAASNKVQAGDLDYWKFNMTSNRGNATLSDVEYRFVYLKLNDIETINKLDLNQVNTPLSEFAGSDSVAGASASAAPQKDVATASTSLWWLVILGSIALASVAVMVTARARKARQSQQ